MSFTSQITTLPTLPTSFSFDPYAPAFLSVTLFPAPPILPAQHPTPPLADEPDPNAPSTSSNWPPWSYGSSPTDTPISSWTANPSSLRTSQQHHMQTITVMRPAALSNATPLTSSSTTPTATPFVATPSQSDSPVASKTKDEVSRGAKVGIALGVTVVVVLSLMACILGFLDCRRRHRRRKVQKSSTDRELSMWEAEMQKQRAGKEDVEIKGGGLWDNLRMDNEVTGGGGSEERRTGGVWERVGEGTAR